MNLIEDLKWRGLIYGVTDEKVYDLLNNEKISFYLGADPTADSLHIGHLVVYLLAKRLEKQGHKPVFLIGGATCFGQPKETAERNLLDYETIKKNENALYKQVSNLFNCEMVNNYDWIGKLDVLDFFLTYGKLFNVNQMINKDVVKSRLETGISYTEFSYQILQAVDFHHLFNDKNCILQIGGQDQWGNIVSGIDLIRKINQKDAYGITAPLITKSDGTKFGKSESGTVWLDKNKTSVYDFYQFWINTPDSDVINRLKQFTFLEKEEIIELEKSLIEEPHLRKCQIALANEVTKLVHGKEELDKAIKITDVLFSGNVKDLTLDELIIALKGIPSVEFDESLINVIVNLKLASSNREAREFIKNGAITINGEKTTDLNYRLSTNDMLYDSMIVLRRGKKKYGVIKKA